MTADESQHDQREGQQTPEVHENNLANDAINVLRGGLMGAADVVPGVSGGTIALIVGIYGRLVTSISRFDTTLLTLISQGKWRAAINHIDLRFLVCLALGIGLGAISLGAFIEGLLVRPASRELTFSVFLGMILASTWIVIQLIDARDTKTRTVCLTLGICAAIFAYMLTGMGTLGSGDGLTYVFLCGVIGICAMILPGISGAYLLIVLGFYPRLTDILHRLKDRDLHVEDLLVLSAFAVGCLLGLIVFSKFLKWLLANYMSPTMAVLAGFMLGATRKIWPFQNDLTPHEDKLKHKVFELVMPEVGGWLGICFAAAAVAFAVVIVVDRLARADRRTI